MTSPSAHVASHVAVYIRTLGRFDAALRSVRTPMIVGKSAMRSGDAGASPEACLTIWNDKYRKRLTRRRRNRGNSSGRR